MMGVYIKGMKMPKYGCDNCFLRTGNYCGRIEKDERVVECARKNERNHDCPLIPVPEHGRLIDADDADSRFTPDFTELSDYQLGWNEAIKRVCEDAPTIIPADPTKEEC